MFGSEFELENIKSILRENHKDTLEYLNAILCKNSDMWKCIYYMRGVGVCGGGDFMLKMEIEGHTSYEDIEKIIKDKIKQEMKWSDNDINWGFVSGNKTNTEFKFEVDKGKYIYKFTITKTY